MASGELETSHCSQFTLSISRKPIFRIYFALSSCSVELVINMAAPRNYRGSFFLFFLSFFFFG